MPCPSDRRSFYHFNESHIKRNTHTYTGKENSVTAWTKNKSGHYVSSKKSFNLPHKLVSL
jgi:hypothetical protein